jgi:hypothetical protein
MDGDHGELGGGVSAGGNHQVAKARRKKRGRKEAQNENAAGPSGFLRLLCLFVASFCKPDDLM